MSYAKQIAEAVLKAAAIEAGAKGLYGLDSLVDLDAIIASVPKPEPIHQMVIDKPFGSPYWLDCREGDSERTLYADLADGAE